MGENALLTDVSSHKSAAEPMCLVKAPNEDSLHIFDALKLKSTPFKFVLCMEWTL